MCLACAIYATDLMWDRTRGIVAFKPAGPGAPPAWLDQLNAAFWHGFRNHRYGMRSRLPEIAEAALARMAAMGCTEVTPREAANYINCQWVHSFAANHFGQPPWLAGALLGFDLLIDTNDPFLRLIGLPGIGPGEVHKEITNFVSADPNEPATHNDPLEHPHDGPIRHKPRF